MNLDGTAQQTRGHRNMVAAFASLPTHQPHGFVGSAGGIVVAATGSPVVLFNEILPVDDAVTRRNGRAGSAARVFDDPNWALFTGYIDGVPVAKSMSYRSGDVVGVYDVATSPAARRRGHGWALTLKASMAGVDAGCTMATLHSSAMAQSMYRAHGFRTLHRYRAFRSARAEPAHVQREP